MNAALRFSRRHALNTMHTAFITELSKNCFARNSEDHFLESAKLRGTRLEVFGFQPGRFRVAMIHAIQIGGEDRRFVPACSGADFHDCVALFGLIGWQQGNLNAAFKIDDASFEFRNFIVGHRCDLNIARRCQFTVVI